MASRSYSRLRTRFTSHFQPKSMLWVVHRDLRRVEYYQQRFGQYDLLFDFEALFICVWIIYNISIIKNENALIRTYSTATDVLAALGTRHQDHPLHR